MTSLRVAPPGARGVIAVDDARVAYSIRGQQLTALDNVTLAIPAGRVIALVGPSGCGKTTLLNLIAGFLRPTSGTVAVDGKLITGPGWNRAVVFQADAVFPWLTVRRNMEFGPRIRRARDRGVADRVAHYLNVMGLEPFADEFPKVLSGGLRKRVDVARAYVNDPDVVLLDEPFGALDDMTKSYLQEEIVRLSVTEPKTSIFVTHDIEEALYVGDQVAVMTPRPGRIRELIDVPFSRPRPAEVRTSPEFQGLRRHIQQLLREHQETEQ